MYNIYVYVSCGEGKKEHGVHHRFFYVEEDHNKSRQEVFLWVVCGKEHQKPYYFIYCVHTMDPFFSTPKTTRKKKKKRDRRRRFLFV